MTITFLSQHAKLTGWCVVLLYRTLHFIASEDFDDDFAAA